MQDFKTRSTLIPPVIASSLETTLESSYIAIRKDREAVLRLMNSTGRLVVDRLLGSTAAMTLCSSVSNSSALILDLSSSVRARVR